MRIILEKRPIMDRIMDAVSHQEENGREIKQIELDMDEWMEFNDYIRDANLGLCYIGLGRFNLCGTIICPTPEVAEELEADECTCEDCECAREREAEEDPKPFKNPMDDFDIELKPGTLAQILKDAGVFDDDTNVFIMGVGVPPGEEYDGD